MQCFGILVKTGLADLRCGHDLIESTSPRVHGSTGDGQFPRNRYQDGQLRLPLRLVNKGRFLNSNAIKSEALQVIEFSTIQVLGAANEGEEREDLANNMSP
ncbi:uncharacterized protein N7484_007820 [Penicillium longicatenatum]|uniref:uncharacterized protein n=1 Tax=Penicillium longicatenatum TaxID=1561947 RepID=UPI0025479D73|nr:uncharacterized protein N7484_007820 [Penicillium longicatenatum]KAJ5639958.1 hypothetical protein N7484_007820 [Penicillium longicatenatum]